jgi:hypothetical protein
LSEPLCDHLGCETVNRDRPAGPPNSVPGLLPRNRGHFGRIRTRTSRPYLVLDDLPSRLTSTHARRLKAKAGTSS